MGASFDILTKPWVPVLDAAGQKMELGLLETLERAHELQAIQTASPMEEYSVYRFLIVFLMDALRPEDENDIDGFLEAEQFDMEAIQDYLTQCRKEGVSFDLFDAERPFLQTTYVEAWDREAKPVSTLDYTIPNGNNHIHFDHRRNEISYTPGKALRMLLTAQNFCTAGAQGYPSNVNGAPPWFALIQGETLFQTLVLGMIGTDEILLPFDEPPVLWRNKKEITAKQEVAKTSWLYGMLFPARRIHLLPDETGERVSEVYLSQGLNYIVTNVWKDPHVPYRTTDKGRFNWKPNDDETIWRNLTYLLDEKDTPQIVEQRKHLNLDEETIHLVLYGVQTNKASYLRQQRHDLRLPVQLIGNEPAERFIHRYIERAEQLGKALYRSLNQEEISKETRVEAQQRFYGVCEQILWALLDTISQPGADLNELFQQKREEMIREVLAQADRVLENQTLRGRTILASGEKWKSLWKECEKIRKEDAR